MSGLVVTDLRVRVGGRTVLDVGHLDVAEATLVVVLGEAGSGKTVLASTLAGCTASTGSVVVDGAVVDGAPSRRLRSGIAVAVRDGERVVGCTVLEALRAAAGDRFTGRPGVGALRSAGHTSPRGGPAPLRR